jgi:hypothetical protein
MFKKTNILPPVFVAIALAEQAFEAFNEEVKLIKDADGGDFDRAVNHPSNPEGIFRIIQSIPSPKAEPLKRWLAKVGYERVQEIEDPELAQKRTRALYKAKVLKPPISASKESPTHNYYSNYGDILGFEHPFELIVGCSATTWGG